MKIGIVGYGVVGRYLDAAFARAGHEVVIFDRYLPSFCTDQQKARVNSCDLVFIAVPTAATVNGECDLSEVREAVQWIARPICLKSTVVPGTTDKLVEDFAKEIVFSPEYIGETAFHHSLTHPLPDVVAVGGKPEICDIFLDFQRSVFGPIPYYCKTDAVTVELAKYMENCFFATKVAFVTQFYLLAKAFGADFTQMRELWVADPRVGRSHSTITGMLGFGGKCLPKDLSAIIHQAETTGVSAFLLESVKKFNDEIRRTQENP